MRPGIIGMARQWIALNQLRQQRRLVLRRRVKEELLIDGRILITIEAHRGTGVAVSVRAPRDVRVIRAECVDRDVQEICEGEDQAAGDRMRAMIAAAIATQGPSAN